MSPATKHNTKWIISSVTGLITIITFAFLVGVGFTENNATHEIIKTELATEIHRSTSVDARREKALDKFGAKLDDVASKQVQVMTKQDRILKDISDLSDKIN